MAKRTLTLFQLAQRIGERGASASDLEAFWRGLEKDAISVMSEAERVVARATEAVYKISPAENVIAGFSPKAERYAPKGAKITKRTPTISKRRYLQKQTAERTGVKTSLEKAATLRRQGELSYSSAASETQAARQRATRKALGKLKSLNRVRDDRGREYRPGKLDQYRNSRRRKLTGQYLPDHEWFAMIDIAAAIGDPRLADLRRSANFRDNEDADDDEF